jgi:hypothetical protein
VQLIGQRLRLRTGQRVGRIGDDYQLRAALASRRDW